VVGALWHDTGYDVITQGKQSGMVRAVHIYPEEYDLDAEGGW
jgi:hypothetical protein